jgi:diguanylate cyclase (GGDEF)-like protein
MHAMIPSGLAQPLSPNGIDTAVQPADAAPGQDSAHVIKLPVESFELLVEPFVEVIQRLSLAKDIQTVQTIVRTAARRLTGADGSSFVLRDGDQCFYADEDSISPLWKGQRFPLNTCISGWVMNNRVPAVIPDIYEDARIPVEAYRPTFVRSLAMVPIRTQAPIGAIGNYWAAHHVATPGELRILQALADSTAIAIENIRIHAELEQRVRERTEQLEAANQELRAEAVLRKQMEAKVMRLSLTDELTGLSNRRGFLLRAEQMLKLVHRVHTQGWLVYIDIDGLKQINDTLGHDAGDRHIRNAAKVLRESFRDADILGRIGGDEFVVFAAGAATPAVEIELRLRNNIIHHNQFFSDQPSLSMSIGIIRCDPHALNTLEDIIHQADAAMYIEKRRKRAYLQNESSG